MRRLVNDHAPPGAPDRLRDRVQVQRRERAQVHHFQVPPVRLGGGRGLQGGAHHRPVRDHGHVAARPHHPGGVQGVRRGRVAVRLDLAPVPVAALGLQEHHRVVRGDRLLDHDVRVLRGGAGDHLQAGRVAQVRLRRLRVVLHRADTTAVRDPQHDRQGDPPSRPVVHLRHLVDDLVERQVREAVELDLAHRPVPAQGQADGGADDAGLRQRGVDHPLVTEVLEQAVGDPEHAAEPAHVLAHDEHGRVTFQRAAQALVEGPADRHHLRHVRRAARTRSVLIGPPPAGVHLPARGIDAPMVGTGRRARESESPDEPDRKRLWTATARPRPVVRTDDVR